MSKSVTTDASIGSRLRQLRGSQECKSVAATAGVNPVSLSRWENCTTISAIDLKRLCDFYGVSVDSVLDSAMPLTPKPLEKIIHEDEHCVITWRAKK